MDGLISILLIGERRFRIGFQIHIIYERDRREIRR
jgi:hypothetical protein